MLNNKWKVFFRFLCFVLLVLYFFVAPIFVLPKAKAFQQSLFITEKLKAGEVLELWNVESFEGGSASRGSFLEKMALIFESENAGNFIVIKTMNLNQAIMNLEQGNLPNLVSFGIGFGEYILPHLINLNSNYKIKDAFAKAGEYGMNTKALPFCYSGYFLIKNGEVNNGKTVFGGADFTNPLASTKNIKNIYEKSSELSGYDAYAEFTQNKFEFLIGTARDFYRCKNREKNGRMNDNLYNPLTSYTDLIQYLAVLKGTNKQQFLAEKFIEFVLKDENQKKLISIGMFSPVVENIYSSNSDYMEIERQFNKISNILNVFYDKEHIMEFKQKAGSYD